LQKLAVLLVNHSFEVLHLLWRHFLRLHHICWSGMVHPGRHFPTHIPLQLIPLLPPLLPKPRVQNLIRSLCDLRRFSQPNLLLHDRRALRPPSRPNINRRLLKVLVLAGEAGLGGRAGFGGAGA